MPEDKLVEVDRQGDEDVLAVLELDLADELRRHGDMGTPERPHTRESDRGPLHAGPRFYGVARRGGTT